ncbi:MAG: hypothetical protein WA957_06495 [Alteraurantiacibacter sp.]
MLRQLLTLFALISGLGLAATPAVAAQSSVVSIAAAADAEAGKAIVSGTPELPRGIFSGRNAEQPGPSGPTYVWAPTVYIQVDRARE